MRWTIPVAFQVFGRTRDSLDDDEEEGMLNDDQTALSDLNQIMEKERTTGIIQAVLKNAAGLALICVPSFAQPSSEFKAEIQRDRTNTSALDGLRGYASVAVMNYHILYAYQSFVFYGYGLAPSDAAQCARYDDRNKQNNWFHQLPILRLVYTGTWPISVFFVISGFALSYKALRESRMSPDGFLNASAAVASSSLRRPFRLFVPPMIATLVTMVAIQLGAYEHGRQISIDPTWVPIINEVHHKRFDTFSHQLRDWCRETWKLIDIFWWGDRHNQYDVHLWTIPTEFRSSLAIFLILPMYVTIRPVVRRLIMCVLILYVYALDRWDVALFFSGLLIADTSLACKPSEGVSTSSHMLRRRFFQALRTVLFILSFVLLSAPDFCMSNTPGFRRISLMIPGSDPAPFRFIPNIGGILLVALVAHTSPTNPFISATLNAAIPQYLGRMSYSLYIVHGPLIHTVGYVVFPFFWKITGREETWRYVTGFMAAYFVLVSMIVLVADLFWRVVDQQCIKITKSFQDRITK